MSKNYYKILGINENCTEQDIKSAYRKLARKWHPDIAGNTDNAISMFKDINEAYEILSNRQKRAEYDTINRYYNYSSTKSKETHNTEGATKPDFNNTNTKNAKNNGLNFNWEDFVTKYKEYTKKYDFSSESKSNSNKKAEQKNSSKKAAKKPQNGNNINTDVEITIAEAVNGTIKIINMLNTQVCPNCYGRNFINGSICPHCKGKGEISEHKRFSVKIPAGIKDNSKIRLSGEGERGTFGGRNGDLYITVHIKAPLEYKTDGNNILKTIVLTPYEAILGANIAVKTLDGNITVKVSPNTQNGQKIRLSGCGVNVNGKIGDMILTVEIQIPKYVSPQEVELYKKLRDISSETLGVR